MNRPCDGKAGHCTHCDQDVPAGPDACLGTLPDTREACCGHGWVATPYVLLDDGSDLSGFDAIDFFTTHNAGPPPVELVMLPLFTQHDEEVSVWVTVRMSDRVVTAVKWTNVSDETPAWLFSGTEVSLISPSGEVKLDVPLAELSAETI